jgi:hypothetical protein
MSQPERCCYECGKQTKDYYQVGDTTLCARTCYEDFVRRYTREEVYGESEEFRRSRGEQVADKARKKR